MQFDELTSCPYREILRMRELRVKEVSCRQNSMVGAGRGEGSRGAGVSAIA